ncbi:rCG21045 [Rattus norvegicus]|uniref:RCG21045 n=1 Tax=Rattus norvegicus TaxID=10116 RepID=A6KDK9_RAT|nr:rCG21045 [Rattus norvegicus]
MPHHKQKTKQTNEQTRIAYRPANLQRVCMTIRTYGKLEGETEKSRRKRGERTLCGSAREPRDCKRNHGKMGKHSIWTASRL